MTTKSGLHVWSLQKRLQEFINAGNAVKFQSGVFDVGGFGWQIIAYPNGNRFENMGSVMIYLKMLSYPDNMPYGGVLTVNFRIQCKETQSSSTFIETYSRVNDSKGWSARNLLLSDLTKESITQITFQIQLNVLKVQNHVNMTIYEAPLRLAKHKFNLRWELEPEMINRFEFANNGKWFESGTYSNMWCFKCAPNGYNDKNEGSCLLFLQLCALPPNIAKMKCKVRLFHEETDTKWTVKKEFGYDTKNAGWARHKLLYTKLMKGDTITFRGEVEILSLLDVRGNKTMFNNGKRTFVASMDDGNMGKATPSKKTFMGRNSRSKTVGQNNAAPRGNYGGYGSHNYQDYFDDGYKAYNKQREEEQKQREQERERKEKESDDDEEDSGEDADSAEDESGDSGSSEEDGPVLTTYQDMKEQVAFLVKEWKKLHKIVGGLKQKSAANDAKIQQLQSDIEMLKGTTSTQVMIGSVTMSPKAISTAKPAVNGKEASGDLLDLLGGMQAAPSAQTQNKNATFGTGGGGAGGAAMSGWTTF